MRTVLRIIDSISEYSGRTISWVCVLLVLVLALVSTGCVYFVDGETTTESVHLVSDGEYHQYTVWLGHTSPEEGVPCDVACNEGTIVTSANPMEVLAAITFPYTQVATNTDYIDGVISWEGERPQPNDCACLAWEGIDDEGYSVSGGDYDTIVLPATVPLCIFLPLVVR